MTLSENWCVVWLAAHDLAARGQANDGVALLRAYFETLPDITRSDTQESTEYVLTRPQNTSSGWTRPGRAELGKALRAQLNSAGGV